MPRGLIFYCAWLLFHTTLSRLWCQTSLELAAGPDPDLTESQTELTVQPEIQPDMSTSHQAIVISSGDSGDESEDLPPVKFPRYVAIAFAPAAKT